MKGLHAKAKTLTLFEENINYLYDSRALNDFLSKKQNILLIKDKNDIFDYVKIKNFCMKRYYKE